MQSWFAAVSALVVGLVLGRSIRRDGPVVVERSVVRAPSPAAEPPLDGPAAEPGAGRGPRAGASPWKLVFGAVMIVFGVVAAIYFAFQLRSVLTLSLVALLLAVGLQGPVARLHQLGVPRAIGLLIIYVGVIAALIVAGWLLLPPVFRDLRALATSAPEYLSETEAQLARFGLNIDLPAIEELEQRALAEVSSDPGSYLGRAFSILNLAFGLFGGVLNALLMLVLSIFILMEGPGFRAHLLSLMAPERARQWEDITRKIAVKIQGWTIGTLFLGLVIGTITTVALLLMGMPYAFLLGLVAGIGELIPMIGPIIAAVPAVGIAAFQGLGMFVGVLVFYILIQQLENYVLVPRIMSSQLDLPGLGVLVAFLVGSELMGVVGGILAMPVAAVVQVLWLDWIVPAIRKGGRSRAVSVQVAVSGPAQPPSR